MTGEQQKYRRWIALAVQNRLPRRLRSRVIERLKVNDYDRAHYDRLVEGFRALERLNANEDDNDPGFARMELDLVADRLFEELDDKPEAGKQTLTWFVWPLMAATSLALGMLFWVQDPRGPELNTDGFAVKGIGSQATLALDAHCIDAGVAPRDAAELLRDVSSEACLLDSTLAFSFRVAAEHEANFLSLFGVDDAGRVLYYAPTPGDDAAVPVLVVERWNPTGLSIELSVNHRGGQLRVYGILAKRAATIAEVDSWASALAPLPPAETSALPWHQRIDTSSLCVEPDGCASSELTVTLQETQ